MSNLRTTSFSGLAKVVTERAFDVVGQAGAGTDVNMVLAPDIHRTMAGRAQNL
jgi:hypothetical protein